MSRNVPLELGDTLLPELPLRRYTLLGNGAVREDMYADKRIVTDTAECEFYHTMDVPGYGHIKGWWDLRQSLSAYLGGVEFKGKRVLEVGVADGYLSFQIEKQGAEVIGYDLSEHDAWDVVPYSRINFDQVMLERKDQIRRQNNGYWLCHQAFGSSAKMVYGTVYEIPREIGMVDISTFGAVLLHVRDPFLALENALLHTRETVIITEPIWWFGWRSYLARKVAEKFLGAYMLFVPNFKTGAPTEMWWILSPEIIRRFIGVLGFEDTQVSYHSQKFEPYGVRRPVPFYTIVGHRTK